MVLDDTLLAFLGWCTVINLLIFILATLGLVLMGKMIIPLHSKLLDIPESALAEIYLKNLSTYKIAILMLNLVPYLALRVVV